MSHASVRTEGYRPLRNQSKCCILQMDCLARKKKGRLLPKVSNSELHITVKLIYKLGTEYNCYIFSSLVLVNSDFVSNIRCPKKWWCYESCIEWPPGYHSNSVKSKNKYGDIHTAEIAKLVNKRRIIQKVKVRLLEFLHYLP